MKPSFEFTANSIEPGDKSGVGVWRYIDHKRGEEVEIVVRQRFDTFEGAHGMDHLIRAAWLLGEADGYAACERNVLNALRGR